MKRVRSVVHFSGRVQGVGFRYQTREIAKGYDVTGYVENLADGRVLLEAEGREDEVEAFLAELQDSMRGYIRNAEVKQSSDLRDFSDFTIR